MKAKLSLNVQFDYITLKTPNGTFTSGRSGLKSTGRLAEVFDKIVKAYDLEMKKKGATIMTVMEKFTDEYFMSDLWPEWNKEHINEITGGCTIEFTHPAFTKKYPGKGLVTEIKKKYAYVKFPNEPRPIGFDMIYMKKVQP